MLKKITQLRNILILTAILVSVIILGSTSQIGYAIPNAPQALVISDDFTYPDGNLVGNGGWEAHSGAGSTPIQVASGEARLQHGSGSREDSNLPLGTTVTTGIINAKFDLRVTDTRPIAGIDSEYFTHFMVGTNDFTARVDVVPPSGSGDYTLGIATFNSTAEATLSTDLNFDETVAVSLSYDRDAGQASLTVGMETISGASDIFYDVTHFALRQSNSSSDETIFVDNLVINEILPTYNTITPDGDLSDWDEATQKLGNINGVDYYLTWDPTYLYVGFNGGNATNGADKYNVAVDIDPNDTGSDNSGTTTAFNGVTFGADGKPDYVLLLDNDNALYKKTGASNWVDDWSSTDSIANDNDTDPGQVEFRLKWEDMGLTNRNAPVGVYVWQSNDVGFSWGSFPPTNLGLTNSEHPLTTRIYLPTTDNGRLPRFYAQHRGDQTQFNADGSFSLLNGFAQIEITSGGGLGCDFKVAIKGNAPADTDNSSVRRQYIIEPSGCSPTADMTLRYMDGDYAAPDERNGYADTGDLKLFRWTGGAWSDEGGTATDANNTVSVTDVSAFSPWTFSTSEPTAVSLQSFTGQSSATPILLITTLLVLLLGSTLFIWQRKRQ